MLWLGEEVMMGAGSERERKRREEALLEGSELGTPSSEPWGRELPGLLQSPPGPQDLRQHLAAH